MTRLASETTVVVGMSGGVDSSVAALLLKEQGFRVIGMFMKNWEEKRPDGTCASAQDFDDVARVCEKIGIPYYGVEFVKEYWDNVFTHFLEDYRKGFTPNPDILCNREIKFKAFLEKAVSLGADFLATGHYAQIGTRHGTRTLLKGADTGKDQSYFLYTLREDTLQKVLFPIGGLPKSEVRRIARENGLSTHAKKDSTGICFIGERNFRPFLKQYLAANPGQLRRLDESVVGTHEGAAYYTLGQRKGLGLGGEGEAWYVVKKDNEKNIVYVERGDDHPALFAEYLMADEMTWVSGAPPVFPFSCKAKIRYRQADQDCVLELEEMGQIRVSFREAQRAITPGQSVVFYDGDVCLGGGIIRKVGPSQATQLSLRKSSSSSSLAAQVGG
jgi:tRNA-uridine 2-sulfurtransferase